MKKAMKRTGKFFLLICVICLSLLGCSETNERTGVPEQQIRNTIQDCLGSDHAYEITDLEITHNIDSQLHTDTVSASYTKIIDYMEVSYNDQYTFQYNKQTDIWNEIIDMRKNNSISYRIGDAILNHEWKDTILFRTSMFGETYTVSYDIEVLELSDDRESCLVSYNVSSEYHGNDCSGEVELCLTDEIVIAEDLIIELNPITGLAIKNEY